MQKLFIRELHQAEGESQKGKFRQFFWYTMPIKFIEHPEGGNQTVTKDHFFHGSNLT